MRPQTGLSVPSETVLLSNRITKNDYFNTGKIMPNKCYRFVTVLYFFRYFLRFFTFQSAQCWTDERSSILSDTFSSLPFRYEALSGNMRANDNLLTLFSYLITKRILRKELYHIAGERRLLTYAQMAECHLRKSRYERSENIIFKKMFSWDVLWRLHSFLI